MQSRRMILGAVLIGAAGSAMIAGAERIDAFENADFEETAKNGRFDAFTEIGRGYGYNGNGGARVSGFQRHSFTLPVKPGLKLRKGERYVFTLDTKNNSKDILEQIAFEVYDGESGRYDHGYWGRKYVDIGAGWSREELAFVPKRDLDSDRDRLKFILFVQLNPSKNFKAGANPEWYIDCDNATLRSDDPLWYFCNTWPTHNRIYSEEGRVRAYSHFIGPFLEADANPVYTLSLFDAKGGKLAERQAEEKAGVLTAAFGKLAYEGAAKLVCELTDRGRTLGRRERGVTISPTYRPKPGEVFINERGQALVDGKPFMPIGMYTSFSPQKFSAEEMEGHLKKIGEAGFNLIIDYSTYMMNGAYRDAFYAACRKYGIRVLEDTFAGYQHKPDKLGEIVPKAKELIKYPALIGFYTMDEASEDKVPVLDRIRRELNQAAPGHVVVTCNIMDPAPYLPTADVQSGDKYPIDAGEDRCLRTDEAYMRRAGACRPAAGWHAPQWLNWANYRKGAIDSKELYEKSGREPTENEMLSVALAYAANGMSGFIFYSYFDYTRGPFPERYEQRWRNMVNVGRTLRSLEPFITSGKRILEIPVENVKGESRVVAMTDGKGDVRVIVYGLDRDNECTFGLDPRFGRRASTCGFVKPEGERYRYSGREFTCDILK